MDPDALLHTSLTEVVDLNVGGCRYTTTLSTLCKYPGSKLAELFQGDAQRSRDSDGSICIDRQGEHFGHILNFLRDGWIPLRLTRAERICLLQESKYYGLMELHEALGGPQDPRPTSAFSREKHTEVVHRSRTALKFEDRAVGRSFANASMGRGTPEEGRLASDGFYLVEESSCDYVRLRYGQEYSGGWIITSPRNLPGVKYELHAACLARSPIEAVNKMVRAGWKPCEHPPSVPKVSDFCKNTWEIMMYKDKVGGAQAPCPPPPQPNTQIPTRQTSASSSAAPSPNSPPGTPSVAWEMPSHLPSLSRLPSLRSLRMQL
eukprot:TRINITY_DN39374_c0_g1_i1.p1 TRINITY_DN39374_c0_g1~~TRINITY_DN39374_c0_g1_i1.p1  ORF type:complete len:319 (+),score=45.62 TRINITY_DN39374_c0_g1_i1:73-1029(+)